MGLSLDKIVNYIFYRTERVGRNGKIFTLWKFRSMVFDADSIGGYSVGYDDHRVTRIGRIIRRWHIDELPNLINVIKGEMNLLGPRPDVAYYDERIPEPEKSIILSVKPGCIDPATIWNFNEGIRLRGKEDPDRYYEDVIWPEKIKRQVAYIKRCCGSGSLRKVLFLVSSAVR